MTATSLKKNILQAIDSIEDKEFLEAVFTIISDKVKKEEEYALMPAQLTILEEREKKHLSGKSRSYKVSELRKAVAGRR